ncbi:hypothetical protein E8E12_004333 [Didymella heteroderae]|uniref:N-acetyltransferase domain-containing protein n=1 Tax=Didymella heteroderae TaxID=1769908 RepID=A0A9P4WJX6_9PLEO|nr:hypothetical protein E8E12_004333 [Didymella heteroderae]
MEPVLLTPRLKLTLITHAERGSQELTWLHELRSNVQTNLWSIHPPSKTLSDTEKTIASYLPATPDPTLATDPAPRTYKLAYAVHETAPAGPPHFIGLVTLSSLSPHHLALPSALVVPASHEPSTLVAELAYSFLPPAWGRGYATEALTAVLDACRAPAAAGFWDPSKRVWMRVIVNGRNSASLRVMRKLAGFGVVEKGVFEWKGERIFIGGEWRTEDDLYIFGAWLRE